MTQREDIRTLNADVQTLIDALDEMQDLYEADQNDAVTVDPSAYAAAQEDVKAAVANLVNQADDMVDRTDRFTAPDGTEVSLPNAALARDGNATELPSNGGGN